MTYKVKSKDTGREQVVHVDRIKRRFTRQKESEIARKDIVSEELVETNERDQDMVQEEDQNDLGNAQDDESYDVEEHVEEPEELGRGRRQKKRPLKYTDYVLE